MKSAVMFAILSAITILLFSCTGVNSTGISLKDNVNAGAYIIDDIDDSIDVKKSKEVIDHPVYGKIIIDTGMTVPVTKSQNCGIKYSYGWGTDHYEPKAGKVLGVWPWDNSSMNLNMLKNKYGYSGIICYGTAQYDTAVNCGYSPENMLYIISYTYQNRQELLDKINSRWARYYYIDEAVNHACVDNGTRRLYQDWEITDIAETVHKLRPGSLFASSGYKYCDHMSFLTAYCDVIMYSGYKNWYDLPLLNLCSTNMNWGPAVENEWIPDEPDQRDGWTEFKNRYGSKFSMTWINTSEVTEYSDLFSHAVNLEIFKVFVYGAGDDPGPGPVPHWNDQWENISYAAWQHGYLRRFEQLLILEWHCDGGCEACDPSLEEGWYLYKVSPLGNIREAH